MVRAPSWPGWAWLGLGVTALTGLALVGVTFDLPATLGGPPPGFAVSGFAATPGECFAGTAVFREWRVSFALENRGGAAGAATVHLVLDGRDFESKSYKVAAAQVLQVHEGLRVPDCALDHAWSHRVAG